jgi:hypothetical protein
VYLYRDTKEGDGNVYRGYEEALADVAGQRMPGSR